jgi:hypothetical protein
MLLHNCTYDNSKLLESEVVIDKVVEWSLVIIRQNIVI